MKFPITRSPLYMTTISRSPSGKTNEFVNNLFVGGSKVKGFVRGVKLIVGRVD